MTTSVPSFGSSCPTFHEEYDLTIGEIINIKWPVEFSMRLEAIDDDGSPKATMKFKNRMLRDGYWFLEDKPFQINVKSQKGLRCELSVYWLYTNMNLSLPETRFRISLF